MASFDSLPDEVALKIVELAAVRNDPFMRPKYNHDFLVDVLCRVSLRFKKLATDSSLWKGRVWISKFSVYNGRACAHEAGWDYGRGKDRFVIEECLNIETREIVIYTSGVVRVSSLADPSTRFPKLKWVRPRYVPGKCRAPEYVKWKEDEDIDDKNEA